jgi:hypothetical protein
MRLFKTKRSFRKEFKRQLRYAIAAACGFLIIFVWRDAVYNFVRTFIKRFIETTEFATTELATAITISVAAVLIIILSSKLLKD